MKEHQFTVRTKISLEEVKQHLQKSIYHKASFEHRFFGGEFVGEMNENSFFIKPYEKMTYEITGEIIEEEDYVSIHVLVKNDGRKDNPGMLVLLASYPFLAVIAMLLYEVKATFLGYVVFGVVLLLGPPLAYYLVNLNSVGQSGPSTFVQTLANIVKGKIQRG